MLHLTAFDADDLPVLSAQMQDAVLKVGDMVFNAKRKIAPGSAAMALFPKELRMAVFSRPMRHHAVVVNAPCAARDKAAALGFTHD